MYHRLEGVGSWYSTNGVTFGMTSTPRSSLPWRHSPKSRAPTSLSLVFAEPQPGSPLASAVKHLPPIKMSTDGDVKTRSATVEGVLLSKTPCEKPQLVLSDPESQTDVEARSRPDHNGERYLQFSLFWLSGNSLCISTKLPPLARHI